VIGNWLLQRVIGVEEYTAGWTIRFRVTMESQPVRMLVRVWVCEPCGGVSHMLFQV
jgi:hypothetical protein